MGPTARIQQTGDSNYDRSGGWDYSTSLGVVAGLDVMPTGRVRLSNMRDAFGSSCNRWRIPWEQSDLCEKEDILGRKKKQAGQRPGVFGERRSMQASDLDRPPASTSYVGFESWVVIKEAQANIWHACKDNDEVSVDSCGVRESIGLSEAFGMLLVKGHNRSVPVEGPRLGLVLCCHLGVVM